MNKERIEGRSKEERKEVRLGEQKDKSSHGKAKKEQKGKNE